MQTLVAIGGAINFKSPKVLEEFIRRAGGTQARVVILPQASRLDDTGAHYQKVFHDLGVKAKPVVLEFTQRSEVDKKGNLRSVRSASGIFITGGAQMRLTTLIGGTELETELLAACRRGTVIAGTSAGAAVLSTLMLAYGKNGATPRERIAQFTSGLGFTDKIIFDQHFRQRDRIGRLAYAVATHPGILGVGVDENTAAIVQDNAKIIVAGSRSVTIVDGRELTSTDVAEMEASRAVAISGLKIHILTSGCTFNIASRKSFIPKKLLSGE
jgi:cyanophycinase